MRAKSATLTSKFQKKFITQQTFKRNYRYLILNTSENQSNNKLYSATKRKPFTSSTARSQNIQSNFAHSFTNVIHTSRNSNRNSNHEPKFRKISKDSNSSEKHQKSFSFSKQIKGVSMDKQTSRQYYQSLQNKPCHDQRLFNNFKLQKPNLQKSFDFSHIISQPKQKLSTANLSYNTQHLYQKYYLKQSSFKCKFDYKCQKKQKGRKFFREQLKQNQPATDLNYDKIREAYQNTSLNGAQPTISFYMNSGRQLPHQLYLRQMTPLKDYWHNTQGVIQRPALDYAQRKMKNDLYQKRMSNIKKKKSKHEFTRDQLCDFKYFQVLGLGRQDYKPQKEDQQLS